MIELVTLRRLHVSPSNVRLTDADEDIDWLADSIHTDGLQQNLVVVPEEDGLFGPGDLGVVEGGRRLRALLRNVELGRITLDELVPVLPKDPADGRTLSLIGNIHKVAMNPADEFAAYAAIVAEHADDVDPIALCARRTGKSEHHVEQRLRLAALAPEILDRLRAGELRLDSAEAYAGVDDQALQLSVYRAEEQRQYGAKHDRKNIRDALRSKTMPATAMQAVYIGIDAYVAEGGRVDRDLFFGADDGEQLLDPSLVNDLAAHKARAEAAELAAQDGFAEWRLAVGFTTMPIWPNAPRDWIVAPPGRPLSDLPERKRATAVGLYALDNDGSGLKLGGWWLPAAPAKPPAPPAQQSSAEQAQRLDDAVRQISGEAALDRIVKARQDRLRLTAAHLVVERTIDAHLGGMLNASWPVDQHWVPTITEVEGDPDTLLVAMQVRVSRAEWEGALPEAEQQLEEATQENDRVAAAEGVPADA